MKTLSRELEVYRRVLYGEFGDLRNGALDGVLTPFGSRLRIIFSNGGNWDHVSVSLPDRCPTWEEMCWVKDQFFWPADCVVQYHSPQPEYRNYHQYCLHLWRHQKQEFPMPPAVFVA